ncbi:MAG: PIN domain nuclease, partial [Thaumarchaeota archaeon]|nr:PIN domain nuclease [Nitrososphaerota archaeon]
ESTLAGAISALENDFAEGRYSQADLLWRSALNRASELSRQFTRHLGTRSLDVFHVASALELGMRAFLSFDARQQNLAKAVGLKLLVPAA